VCLHALTTSSGSFSSRYSRVIFALFFARIAFSRSGTFKRERNDAASQLAPSRLGESPLILVRAFLSSLKIPVEPNSDTSWRAQP
jgi:hypothetical protein